MRFLLIDLASDGIVYASDFPLIANRLKQGFTDVSLRPIFPSHPNFADLTHDSVKQKSFTMNDHTDTASITSTPSTSYLEIKRLCYLRENPMVFLMNSAKANIGKTVLFPYSDITPLVKSELLYSASDAIAEYAAISDIDFDTAKSELKVMIDSETQVKIRMMALVNKHVRLIHKITSHTEFLAAKEAMNLDFYKSSWL